jgi:tRNA modification GTPase
LKIALIGHPNAGKSSLMNALLERERSIVSHLPGTTRDTVEEVIQLEGIQIRLIDTAGLRDSDDAIEQLGIARTRQAINEADLLLWIVDNSQEEVPLDPDSFPTDIPVLRCLNKSDLPSPDKKEGIPISSKDGTGLSELRQALIQALKLASNASSSDEVVINARHQVLLQQASQALQQALQQKKRNAPPELISSDLREALHAIGEIVGQVTNEDILDRLFQNFCLGK